MYVNTHIMRMLEVNTYMCKRYTDLSILQMRLVHRYNSKERQDYTYS